MRLNTGRAHAGRPAEQTWPLARSFLIGLYRSDGDGGGGGQVRGGVYLRAGRDWR